LASSVRQTRRSEAAGNRRTTRPSGPVAALTSALTAAGESSSATSLATCLTSPGLSVFLEGDLHDAHPDGLVGHDPSHVLDQLLLLPHLHRVRGGQQVQLVPPALQGAGGDVHVLADVGGRPASVLLLDGPYPGLLGMVFLSHYGGVLVFLGWVVSTPSPPKVALSWTKKAALSHAAVPSQQRAKLPPNRKRLQIPRLRVRIQPAFQIDVWIIYLAF